MIAPRSLDGLGPTLLAVAWSFCAASTVLMGMRIYTNGFITRLWSANFWWALASYFFCLLANVFLTVSVAFGLGDHLADLAAVDPHLISLNQFYQWLFTTFNIVGITMGKIAIILFILDIESGAKSRRQWILYILLVANVIVNVILIPILWVQCTPTTKIWDDSIPGNCAGRQRNELYGYFQGSFGAFLDFTVAIYPALIFWNLQLRLHVKVGLIVLFGFGVIASVCAAFKTSKLGTVTATSDITYLVANLAIWATTETWIVLIVSCVPPVRPIFSKFLQMATNSLDRSGYTQEGTSKNLGTKANAYASHSRTKPKSQTASTAMPLDNDSEEEILGQEGIIMTKQISVRYQEAVSEVSDGRDEAWKTHYNGV